VDVDDRRRPREAARHRVDVVGDRREAPELRRRAELQLERQLARLVLCSASIGHGTLSPISTVTDPNAIERERSEL
jgi:hypothetical protein